MISKLAKRIVRRGYRLSLLGQKLDVHITRYRMYNVIRTLPIKVDRNQRILSISNSQALAREMGFRDDQIVNAVYPDEDILSLSYADSSFDALVSDQVLEHVRGNPFRAVAESFRVVKSGGLVCHSTCLVNPIHLYPEDYWRFTPEALRLLIGDKGEIFEIGAWGNYWVWFFCKLGLRYEPIPTTHYHPARWLADHNDVEWPIVVWVIAKKK
jgi:SAM-dependent methyltransferase